MKKLYILYVLIISMIMSQEFNPGPYGVEYFDIAGPFHFPDLNNDNTILGGIINTYLLEQTRIVNPSNKERNYHIFYMLLKGLDKKTVKKSLY